MKTFLHTIWKWTHRRRLLSKYNYDGYQSVLLYPGVLPKGDRGDEYGLEKGPYYGEDEWTLQGGHVVTSEQIWDIEYDRILAGYDKPGTATRSSWAAYSAKQEAEREASE